MIKSRGVSTEEWRLKNYLDKHNIYKGEGGLQTIIINSFYNEHNERKGRLDVNDNEWKDKLKYTLEHFGSFAQYAQNNWKRKSDNASDVICK